MSKESNIKVKYSNLVQAYMEVFDYLMLNNKFIYASGMGLLKARVKITDKGFMEELQERRGVWNEDNCRERLISTEKVLKLLNENIDYYLFGSINDIPTSPEEGKYAYSHDSRNNFLDKKDYYRSYMKLFEIYRDVYNDNGAKYKNGNIVSFDLLKYKKLSKRFSIMSEKEKREIECYANIEKKIFDSTYKLLLSKDSKGGKKLTYKDKLIMFPENPNFGNGLYLHDEDSLIDFEDFRAAIRSYCDTRMDSVEKLIADASISDDEKTSSELGLKGRTR